MTDDHDEETPRETFHHDPIGHAEARGGMTVGELADEYGKAASARRTCTRPSTSRPRCSTTT